MKWRTVGWILGGSAVFLFLSTVLFFFLLFFTHVFDPIQEQTMYHCTACLKSDSSKCKTIGTDWESNLYSEEAVRRRACVILCTEVVSWEENRDKLVCVHWVNEQREQIFDIRCTSHVERRYKPKFNIPWH